MKSTFVNRRHFVKSTLIAGMSIPVSFPSKLFSNHHKGIAGQNWAKSFTYGAARFHQPATVHELRRLIRQSRRVKALGGRHSFSRIADTDADLISTSQFNRLFKLDKKNHTVTLGSGIKYGEFSELLHNSGYAVHNLASLPHIQIGGAIGTATHGSGDDNGNLATPVTAIELVTADGNLLRLKRGDHNFEGAVIHLGALGVITKVTLDVLPTFDVQQYVYIGLTQDQLQTNFDNIFSSTYSASVFTDWQEDPRLSTIWVKHKINGKPFKAPMKMFGAKLADHHVHPIVGVDAEICTPQMGEVGPWFDRLPHFLMGFRPSTGAELQSEFFVPRMHAVAGIRELYSLRQKLKSVLQISEIRTIKADNYWMSTAFGTNCVAFHFTWIKDPSRVLSVLPLIERKLSPFRARPHWGKLTTIKPKVLQSHYPKILAFRQLAAQLDPSGKFHNDYLKKYVLA